MTVTISTKAVPDLAGINIILNIKNTDTKDTDVSYKMTIFRKSKMSSVSHCVLQSSISIKKGKQYCYTFLDPSIESGVPYSYGVNFYGADNTVLKQATLSEAETAICFFDDLYFVDKGTTFCVRFNPQVGGIKYNIQESITSTFGNQYPIYRRNGMIKYQSFSVNGTISIDAEEMLGIQDITTDSTKKGIVTVNPYKNSPFFGGDFTPIRYSPDHPLLKLYNTYQSLISSNIIDVSDLTMGMEKAYRDQIIAFLTSSTPKLFKSPTEGNMLVQISNVQLTPNQQLGRMIYDFSCQVTEIAKIDTYSYLDIFQYDISTEWQQVSLYAIEPKNEEMPYRLEQIPQELYGFYDSGTIESFGGDEVHEVCTLILRLVDTEEG